jgi:hypothetical protein
MGKQTTPTLDQRIAAALRDETLTSEALGTLYAEATSALSSAEAEATKARERATDPIEVDPDSARTAARDAEARAERLQAELPRLASRYHAARVHEAHAEWFPHYEAVGAEVITAAEDFAQRYDQLSEQMVELLTSAAELDKKVEWVNGRAPAGETRRLVGVELTARKLPNFSSASGPSIAERLKLPAFENTNEMHWPQQPSEPFGVTCARAMDGAIAALGDPAHDVAGYHRKQGDALRAMSEYHANFFRSQRREQEERERKARNAANIAAHEQVLREAQARMFRGRG